jgi:hypothetical protein
MSLRAEPPKQLVASVVKVWEANEMNVNRLAAAAAIAAGVGMSALTSGLWLVNAAPLNPPLPAPTFHQDPAGPPPGIPAEKCWRYGRSGGGSPRGGGGMPGYLPQCPVGKPPPG